MFIKQIRLTNFRNYSKKIFDFESGINLIIGDNAVGKTNILEAIYLLASGKSFRVKSVEREMIKYGEEIARISAKFEARISRSETNRKHEITNPKLETELEIVLTTGEVGGEKAGKKRYLVEGVPKRGFDFLGHFRAVYFGPEDLELITDSPSLRRKYLDSVLVQVDREYARCLLAYEKGIRARNKLLEGIREELRSGDGKWEIAVNSVSGIDGVKSREARSEGENIGRTDDVRRRLYFWDQLVIKNGNVLTEKRGRFIDFLNGNFLHLGKTNEDAFINLNSQFCIEYDRSLISEERLKQYEREEVASATTLVGPHRDDFVIKISTQNPNLKSPSNKLLDKQNQMQNSKSYEDNYIDSGFHRNDSGRDLSIYGSRGEQRLAILWLKLGELAFIEKETGDRPVLLLDDIFSELDEGHRELVLELIGKQQTILTTADKEVKDRVRDRGSDGVIVMEI